MLLPLSHTHTVWWGSHFTKNKARLIQFVPIEFLNAKHISRKLKEYTNINTKLISNDRTQKLRLLTRKSRDSSVGRASDWRSEGPWFNPGSRHNLASFKKWKIRAASQRSKHAMKQPMYATQAAMAEWLRRLTWNQMGSTRVGSNPTRSVRTIESYALPWTK